MNSTRRIRRDAFLAGVGSILCLGGASQPMTIINPTAGRSDADALFSDWRAIGGDIQRSIEIIQVEAASEQ